MQGNTQGKKGKTLCVSHQAWRAQIGSISVTHTMAPKAFKAEQQPLPTYTEKISHTLCDADVCEM